MNPTVKVFLPVFNVLLRVNDLFPYLLFFPVYPGSPASCEGVNDFTNFQTAQLSLRSFLGFIEHESIRFL